MLTRHIVDLLRRRTLQYLVQRVELTRLREVTQITGVNDEIGFVGHGVDLVDCGLQSGGDVRVGRFVKSDVAVADLYKGEVPAFSSVFAVAFSEGPRRWNAAAHSPDQAGTCPCHALQESPTIDTVVIEVLQFLIDKIFVLVRHLASDVFVAFTVDNWSESVLFPQKKKGIRNFRGCLNRIAA